MTFVFDVSSDIKQYVVALTAIVLIWRFITL